MASTSPVDQNTLWNGPGGQIWVAQQAILDGLFQPMADLLVAELPETITQLLDIGCGTGASLLATGAARPAAHCTGLDISAPMLAMARKRAEAAGLDADFIVADAQQHPLPSGHFDWIQSRLGVMFFEDTGAAFANLHRAARPDSGLRFIAWRSAEENPFMTTAERAIGDELDLPPRRPGAPGQFAFADGERIHHLLQAAGWKDVEVTAVDLSCSLARNELPTYVGQLGALGLALRDLPGERAAALRDKALAAFTPFIEGDRVRVDAACWLIRARA
ncbi:class I SAM-dependent methyltransferase [Stenotrophomonas sp. 59]|uniref:class I SAM-dependent methyltransferase n=1 Tax=Stenotrophomonas sp. 59 TaxID=3051120 RepID=UPI00256F4574|nr:class I SAM-dependent methyltransferase [Stenotrophomonas sp. 59]